MAKLFVLGFLCTVAVLGAFGKPSLSKSRFETRKHVLEIFQSCTTPESCEAEAKAYLEGVYERNSSAYCRQQVEADWNYNTDLTNTTKEEAVTEANIAYANFIYKTWNETIKNWDFSNFKDEKVKRQLEFLNIVGTAALNEQDLKRYNEILGQMANRYGTAKICPFDNQDCNLTDGGINLEPDIEAIISTSRNSAELAYVWKAWRDAAGAPIREQYKEYIALSNKAAVANGLKDNGDLWLARYEAEDFRDQVKLVWEQVEELYKEVYAYVRYRLREVYPDDIKNPDDPIPAHLLGNMWAQTWEGIYDLVIPFPNAPGFDVTKKLQEKYGPEGEAAAYQMFEEANRFFIDLGLEDMTDSYNTSKAMIVRPNDGREVTCHASAWDFCDGVDYRIKMCTNVNQEDFITIHHELGHIQYFMQYRDMPITFRDGANPGFHEAIGDVLALSVATPRHMFKLGFVDDENLNYETTINFLMQKALEKIAFLPFGYLIDAYRWRLFDGSITEDKMEYEWLKLRNEIEGLVPPVMRSEADFDAGAKYHVPGNTPYIRYFVSFIIQFQIHKELCIAAGQYNETNPDPGNPLYNCDIDGSVEAGDIMRTLLMKGFSENWEDILNEAIGTSKMDPNAIKEYFQPLTEFLTDKRNTSGYPNTWSPTAFEAFYSNSETEDSNITTPMIIVGIIQGGGIVVVAVIYVVKTFIMKR